MYAWIAQNGLTNPNCYKQGAALNDFVYIYHNANISHIVKIAIYYCCMILNHSISHIQDDKENYINRPPISAFYACHGPFAMRERP